MAIRNELTEEIQDRKNINLAMTDEELLTPAENKLLEVMINPDTFDLNVKQKCEIADISRSTYYATMKKPHFTRMIKKASSDLVIQDLPDVVKALIREAKGGNTKAIEMAMIMAGIYSKDINVNSKSINVSLDGKDIQNMTDEELLKIGMKMGVVDDE